MSKKPATKPVAVKTKRVKIASINDLSITTTAKSGEVTTFRAGKIAFVMSQVEGCKIFCDNGLHVESKDPAEAINAILAQCYTCAEQGYYEAVVQPEPNRKERRAAAANAK